MLPITKLTIDLSDEKHGPSVICKRLIDEGFPSNTPVQFYRGKTLCFTSPSTVGDWSNLQVREATDGKPMRFVNRG